MEYNFENNKPYRHFKLNIVNLTSYLIIYIVSLVSYVFICSYLHLFILVLLTIVPFVSNIMLIFQLKKLAFRISISDKNIYENDVVHVGLLLDNKSLFTSLDVKVNLHIANSFFITEAPLSVQMASIAKNLNKTIVPFEAMLAGIINVCVKDIEIKDMLGIVSYRYDVDKNVEVDVFPSSVDAEDIDKTGLYEGVSENEETNTKGNDLSDVSNIREYIPGDRIKDIHWKLSAKKDILLVKERVRVSERQLIMLVDTSGEKKDINRVLGYAYTLVKMCLIDGIPTRLVWWNGKESQVENAQIMSYEDLKSAYVDLYRCGLSKDMDEIKNNMKYIFTNVASYIHICCENGEVKGVPVDNV